MLSIPSLKGYIYHVFYNIEFSTHTTTCLLFLRSYIVKEKAASRIAKSVLHIRTKHIRETEKEQKVFRLGPQSFKCLAYRHGVWSSQKKLKAVKTMGFLEIESLFIHRSSKVQVKGKLSVWPCNAQRQSSDSRTAQAASLLLCWEVTHIPYTGALTLAFDWHSPFEYSLRKTRRN